MMASPAPELHVADRLGRSGVGWATAASVFILFTIMALANMQTGLHGDLRTVNPEPGTAPYPPFLGVTNWATFTVFDPRVAHFPLSWHYFNASPLLEPTLSFLGGYASYYVLTGVGLL